MTMNQITIPRWILVIIFIGNILACFLIGGVMLPNQAKIIDRLNKQDEMIIRNAEENKKQSEVLQKNITAIRQLKKDDGDELSPKHK